MDQVQSPSQPIAEPPQAHAAFGAAWMMALGILLSFVPVVGPFVAGVVGGRRARTPGMALAAAVLPCVFLGSMVALKSRSGIDIKGHITQLPPALMAGMQTVALLAGAFTGAAGRASKVTGFVLLVGAMVLFQQFYSHQIGPAISLYRSAQSDSGRAAPTTVLSCTDNLTKLYNAAMSYTDDWDGKLPPANRWMSALTDPTESKLQDSRSLRDPSVAASGYGYAMNAALSGKKTKDVKDAAATPMFYDSTDISLNAHDAVTSLPSPGRHNGHNNLVYLDGHLGQR